MRSRRISLPCCLGVIESAANLSLSGRIHWTVGRRPGDRSLAALARSLTEHRRRGQFFLLPPEAGDWFRLSFAIGGARHALAFQYVWAVSVADQDRSSPSPADLLLWWLRPAMPRTCARDLRRMRRALSAVDRRLS